MLEKRGVINPKNFFDVRQLEFEAPHLSYMDIPVGYNLEQALAKWIDYNLKNRYYIGKSVAVDSNNRLDTHIRVGFEDPKELSYFALACPHLKYK